MEECKKVLKIYDLEGYAIAGLITSAEYISCGKGKSKIVAKLANNETVCSECMENKFIELSKKVIEIYKTFRLLEK
ncbi:hypothetical protein QPL79_03590 [Ignisphaera sp. 4213-co]|uniref:Uncharacterized protein n=1 Tax=Ignisphaera cupida TaxID=3050454 RepID=A0ABD4Z5F3_9CREN|nr:hypothetical protein [Ignisphaera sp. 4213-co]MDK6028439.1 hypothetical protein [Ignisphaera sp. 4213-co]